MLKGFTRLEPLYKRTSTGAIQIWMIVWKDGYTTATQGQLDGKKQEYKKEIKGKNIGKKNETTSLAQAEFDARSDWREKKDKGYKTLEELQIFPYKDLGYTIGDLEAIYPLEDALNRALPKYNTDASGNVKPMLAHSVKEDFSNVKFPCLAQPKKDGARCLVVVTERDIKFLSRSGKEYTTLGHIRDAIKKYLQEEVMGVWDDSDAFILDGEIYSDELTFQETIQAIKKQGPNSQKLKIHVYDIVNDEIQEKRFPQMSQKVSEINSNFIVRTVTGIVWNKEEVEKLHNEWVSEGDEGLMIRHNDGVYQQGQRSHSLLKYKKFDENEFHFGGWEIGQRAEDLIALCSHRLGDIVKVFRAKMEGSKAQKEALQREYPNETKLRKITVKHFGWTDDGLPRFPIGKAIRDYE